MIKSLINDKEAQKIFEIIEGNGGEVRFVGGCVRDAILGIPLKDIDIASTLPPEKVLSIFTNHNIKAIPTGIKFGTITVIINNKPFEVTTLREDIETDGRHAKVKYTDDWSKDASRRDFTINAMSCNLDGKIFDYYGGHEDLKNRKVRFVGEASKRILEDYLRILRFFRFSAYYGSENLDLEALISCKELASNLLKLSGERIQAEMKRILIADTYPAIIDVMDHYNVIPYLGLHVEEIEEITNLKKIETHLKVNSNYLRPLSLLSNNIESLSEVWKFSNNDKIYLKHLLNNRGIIKASLTEKELKKLIRNYGKELFIDLVLLEYSKNPSIQFYETILLAEKFNIPIFPIKGEDLIKLGYKSDKKLGDTLRRLEEVWEERDYLLGKSELLKYI